MGVRIRLGAGPCPHLATWANLTVEMRGQKATIYLGERLVAQMVSRPRARGRVGLLAAARKGSILVFRSPSLGHRPNSVGTSHGYVTRLRHTATSHGYVTRLHHATTSRGYVTSSYTKTSFGYTIDDCTSSMVTRSSNVTRLRHTATSHN